VISLASLIFKRLIREAQVIENKRIIDLSDCDMASIQAVMEYIYTGREVQKEPKTRISSLI